MNIITKKLKEVFVSVAPVTGVVLLLHFTIAPLDTPTLFRFLIGALLIVIGMAIFLFGVDLGITAIGEQVGNTWAKSKNLIFVIITSLILGFIISVAEPDLNIFAGQVEAVTGGIISKIAIVLVVSIGIGLFMTIGLLRIVKSLALNKILIGIYLLILILGLFSTPEFLAIAFDASGATTGALTVPFILALASGLSRVKKNSLTSEEDSFGLVGVTSAGAIIAVLIMNIISGGNSELTGKLEESFASSSSILAPFLDEFSKLFKEIIIALLPIVLVFVFFQLFYLKLNAKSVRKIIKGLVYTYIGLVIFLTGVNSGFMEAGGIIGQKIASMDNNIYLIVIGFVLGLVTIIAEPAVSVLTHQVEDVTSGYVKRKSVLFSLSIGVGLAIALSMIRIIVPEIQLWHFLLPGYFISIVMSLFAPNLFVGIAFDSGGVASGPMAATFILAFTHGAAQALDQADVLVDGFGMIAMVALTPLIALQTLGLIYKIKTKKRGIENE